MKKFLGKIILAVIVAIMLVSAVGCSDANFTKTSFKSWGNVESNYGFMATTGNYVYFINGQGDSKADNNFGAPIKGSLMVADKNDLQKSEIAVPKLFVASDYNQGLFISGSGEETYVYYGTPNSEKNSKGEIANAEMSFTKTRLDGEKTEVLFTIDSLATEYRFFENNGVVYLIYVEGDSIILYNTKTSKSETVIEKDIKKSESLNEYKFLLSDDLDKAVLIYTTTVYEGEYFSDESRITATYNKLYAYTVGNGSTLIFDGKTANETYSIKYVTSGKVFYTVTDENSNVKTYQFEIATTKVKEVKLVDEIGDKLLFGTTCYTYDGDAGKIYSVDLLSDGIDAKVVVALAKANKLLFTNGDYIYYVNSDSYIARIELNNEDAKEERVSESKVSTSWYAPKLLQNKYLAFLDADGYVKYVDITASAVLNEDEIMVIENEKLLGKRTASDEAKTFSDTLVGLTIDLDKDSGEPSGKLIAKARSIYDGLSKEALKEVSGADFTKLQNYEKALEISKEFYKLNELKNKDVLSKARLDELKTVYLSVKEKVNALSNKDDVIALVDNNLKANYFVRGNALFED